MRWFKKSKQPQDPLVIEARANLPILEALRGNVGWGLVKGWCVGEANLGIQEWSAGVPHERQLFLAARVTAMAWVVDLIDNRMSMYRKVLESSGELPGVEEDDDGTKPFVDPYEKVEEVG